MRRRGARKDMIEDELTRLAMFVGYSEELLAVNCFWRLVDIDCGGWSLGTAAAQMTSRIELHPLPIWACKLGIIRPPFTLHSLS